MAHATQDPGGFRAADQGLATAPFGASAPEIKGRRAWPRPLARRGPWRGLRYLRPLLDTRERHLAARAHGKGSGIKESAPCPGRIKPRRMVLDANRADGIGGGATIR
jgi:hypothetical protein